MLPHDMCIKRTKKLFTPLIFPLLLALTSLFHTCDQGPLFLSVPYVTTPDYVVDRMMQMGNVGPGDYLIDLGSGDGRIVIAAAKRGAMGHGVEIDPERNTQARENARESGVSERVMFLRQDLFKTDFSQASIVTMFLLTRINESLRPHLLEELTPGSRVMSHKFAMGDWQADNTAIVEGPDGNFHYIYLWIIPARVEGRWTWKTAGQLFTMNIHQEYQEIEPELLAGNSRYAIEDPVLRGERIRFTARTDTQHFLFTGEVDGDTITGYVQIRSNEGNRIRPWRATRSSN